MCTALALRCLRKHGMQDVDSTSEFPFHIEVGAFCQKNFHFHQQLPSLVFKVFQAASDGVRSSRSTFSKHRSNFPKQRSNFPTSQISITKPHGGAEHAVR